MPAERALAGRLARAALLPVRIPEQKILVVPERDDRWLHRRSESRDQTKAQIMTMFLPNIIMI